MSPYHNSPPPLNDFLEKLREGEAVVAGSSLTSALAVEPRLLWRIYEEDAWHFPGFQPSFDEALAVRAALWLYEACRCYADHAIGREEVRKRLEPLRVPEATAEAHYTVDLFFRHGPALHGLARGLAADDPLVEALVCLGWHWPLSAPGLPLWPLASASPDLSVIRSHPGLWRLYLDRIVLFSDKARLSDPATRQAARAALGDHPELALNLYPELVSL